MGESIIPIIPEGLSPLSADQIGYVVSPFAEAQDNITHAAQDLWNNEKVRAWIERFGPIVAAGVFTWYEHNRGSKNGLSTAEQMKGDLSNGLNWIERYIHEFIDRVDPNPSSPPPANTLSTMPPPTAPIRHTLQNIPPGEPVGWRTNVADMYFGRRRYFDNIRQGNDPSLQFVHRRIVQPIQNWWQTNGQQEPLAGPVGRFMGRQVAYYRQQLNEDPIIKGVKSAGRRLEAKMQEWRRPNMPPPTAPI